ncbi:hypothetical protein D3C86_1411320 [compost metagenome]
MQRGQALVFGTELLVQAFDVGHVEPALRTRLQILVGADGGVELLENAAIVHQHPIALGVVQAVDPRHCLDQVVALERLVDVQHRIARLVEAGEQLVHHDEQIGVAIGAEVEKGLFLVRFRIGAMRCHRLLPPPLHFRQRFFVDVRVALARVGW